MVCGVVGLSDHFSVNQPYSATWTQHGQPKRVHTGNIQGALRERVPHFHRDLLHNRVLRIHSF